VRRGTKDVSDACLLLRNETVLCGYFHSCKFDPRLRGAVLCCCVHADVQLHPETGRNVGTVLMNACVSASCAMVGG
jgi:hypothetical protein